MSEPEGTDGPQASEASEASQAPEASEPHAQRRTETAAERKRRLDAIFGEVLPETTRDERDPDGPTGRRESTADAWLRAQVPPHHGG